MKNVLFICTGNTCRSPMAEGYLKHKNLEDIEVLSAGIFADGSKVSENAKKVCENFCIDISEHVSTQLSEQMLKKADYILCMNENHKQILDSVLGQNKAIILGDSIPDPFGCDEDTYRECFLKIKSAVDKFCERYL